MRSLRGSFAVLVAAVCLAVPAGALAQSAGDDQYADPFNEQPAADQPAGQPDDQPDDSSSGGNDSSSQVADTTDSSSAAADTGESDGRLAYTGFDLPLLFVTGAVMLLAGFTVRRVLAGPYATPR